MPNRKKERSGDRNMGMGLNAPPKEQVGLGQLMLMSTGKIDHCAQQMQRKQKAHDGQLNNQGSPTIRSDGAEAAGVGQAGLRVE